MLKEMFGEGGQVSMMRAMMFAVTANIMAVWTAISIQDGAFADMPPEMIAIMATFVTGKVVQKFPEAKGNGNIIIERVEKPTPTGTGQPPIVPLSDM